MPRTTRACQLVLSAERAGAYKTDLRAYRAALDALYDEPDLRRLAEVA